jgi:ferredoxin
MRIVVDWDRCEFHGQCMIAAPDIFDLRGDGDLRFVEHPDESLRAAAEDAMDACPTQAIAIED